MNDKIKVGDLLFAWYDEEGERMWVDTKPQHPNDPPIGIAGVHGEIARAGVVNLGRIDVSSEMANE